MQGAHLGEAQLQGADLTNTELQGADLGGAQMQGASLFRAQLQGADLSRAQLQGADLTLAQLQGADLTKADLGNAEFMVTFVFRTDTTDANVSTSATWSVQADQVKPRPPSLAGEISQALALVLDHKITTQDQPVEPLLPADVDKWKAAATEFASETDELCRHFLEPFPIAGRS